MSQDSGPPPAAANGMGFFGILTNLFVAPSEAFAAIVKRPTVLLPIVILMALNAGFTVHLDLIRGDNPHHIVEAAFKAFARCLDAATALDPRVTGVPSTKGAL